MDAVLTAMVLAVGVLDAVALTVGSVAGALMDEAVVLPDAVASIMAADSRAAVSEAALEAGFIAAVASTVAAEAGFTGAVGSTVEVAATAADIAN